MELRDQIGKRWDQVIRDLVAARERLSSDPQDKRLQGEVMRLVELGNAYNSVYWDLDRMSSR